MKKYLIIVEGKADVVFLRDYLKLLDNNFILKNKKKEIKSENLIESENIKIKIFVAGSYNGIERLKNKIMPLIDLKVGYKLLVIQDADNPKKRDGGVDSRLEYLNKIKEKLDVEFEIFLFPNNKDDGDLETLLLQISCEKINYKNFLRCNINYKKEIKEIALEFSDELDEDKYKIFHYFRTFYGSSKAKEENRVYEKEYWDFSHDALNPLRKFIKKEMNI